MRVLFVIYDNEGSQNPLPMGVCYIASYLRQHGYDDITFYNQDVYHYPEEHLTQYLDKNKFDILGIGFVAGYHQHKKILSICGAINKSKNRPFVVLGGHGASPVPLFYLEKTGANAVVIGEGEKSFLEIVKALDERKPVPDVVRFGAIKDLDSIPEPYYDALPMEYYLNQQWFTMNHTDRFIPMITSRGCPYHCNFCQRLEKSIRFRSAQAIVDELWKYVSDYRVNFVQFWDELFTLSEARVYELTQVIRPFKINYWCTARVDNITHNMIEMLKESGCVYIDYGIEQFDNQALEAMGKKQTEAQIINAIELTQEAGIKIGFNIIFGNLGDNVITLWKSLQLLRKYNDYGQLRTIRPVTPYPGTPLYNIALDRGLLTGAEDFYEKHKNAELLTCNFTDISDDKVHEMLWIANQEIIEDYYQFQKHEMLGEFADVYFGDIKSFRGARHR